MFGKVFRQIYDSSIVENPEVRFTFMDFIVLADSDGIVDMTHDAIARRTNRPLSIIRETIRQLESADPLSRTPDEQGARIVRLDEHRDWGWEIVNYEKFRNIRDEDDRRRQNREAQQRRRNKLRQQTSANVSTNKPKDNPSSSTSSSVRTEGECEGKQSSPTIVTPQDIYQAYPRKVARPTALKAIQKALKTIDPEELLAKTKAYAATQIPGDPYTPHPATWFNQERYDDLPETWQRNGANGSSNGNQPRARSPKEERHHAEYLELMKQREQRKSQQNDQGTTSKTK